MTGVAPGVHPRQGHQERHLARPGSRLARRQPDALRLAGPRRRRRGVEPPRRAHPVASRGHPGLPQALHRRHARRRGPRAPAASATARASSTTSAARSNRSTARLSRDDRRRLDLFLSSVREAEQQLQQDEHWSTHAQAEGRTYQPPTSDFGGPQLLQRSRQWYDIVHLPCRPTRPASSRSGSARRSGRRSTASTSATTTPRTTARTRPSSSSWP